MLQVLSSLLISLSLLVCLRCGDSHVLIYHTENSPSLQYYDCIYYTVQANINNDNIIRITQGIKYCIQLVESQELQRDFNQSCFHGGTLLNFSDLRTQNITIADVLSWSSGIEQADKYAKYLFNYSDYSHDDYLCNCTDPNTFGKYCEYEFYFNRLTFDEAIREQFQPIMFDQSGSQFHNNRPCYTTLECDFGLLCLDWRHICDGKQQCMNGLDEDYCDKLEYNECEDDEYRCSNGMCVPEEYWLDSEYDCMDWTDEMGIAHTLGYKCMQTPSFDCDERLCVSNGWSCGDGQCINVDTNRQKGIQGKTLHYCVNYRDMNYMCEAITRHEQSYWTIDEGYCLAFQLPYKEFNLDRTSNTNPCIFAIKCALTEGLDVDCACHDSITCSELIDELCTSDTIEYPAEGHVITPYLKMEFRRERDWSNKFPDDIRWDGSIKCRNYQIITVGSKWSIHIDDNIQLYLTEQFERWFCGFKKIPFNDTIIFTLRNYSGPHYDGDCWQNIKTYNNYTYQVSFLCSHRCLSTYRVRDGISDCEEDEQIINQVDNSCPRIQHHRFVCSSTEMSCLMASALGDFGSSCSNGRDEYSFENGFVIQNNVICQKRDDEGCSFLRKYIRQSSSSLIHTNDFNTFDYVTPAVTKIPFLFYCDSFFNTESGKDETDYLCRDWICRHDEYKCLSGQCIQQEWVCDGVWDCSDASDEERLFLIDVFHEHNSKIMNLSEIKEKCRQQHQHDNTPFSNLCKIEEEYPCFRANVSDSFDVILNQPCININQIGDGIIDCIGGHDERNTLICDLQGMLGYQFMYQNGECTSGFYDLCANWKPDSERDTVCFQEKKTYKNGSISDCSTQLDVMCLNDKCIKNAKCNKIVECDDGEDEYWCNLEPSVDRLKYRDSKRMSSRIVTLINYPIEVQNISNAISIEVEEMNTSESNNRPFFEIATSKTRFGHKSVYEYLLDNWPDYFTENLDYYYLPYICNRGLGVKDYSDATSCFCPPSFYGRQCEFYSDRITVLTHLDLRNYHIQEQSTVIKVLTTFLFEDRIIDYYEFHVYPFLQTEENYIKQKMYFLYPRTNESIGLKKNNRSGTQLYSIRFEAFELSKALSIESVGIWHFPIYFDNLPSFRLAKILRLERFKRVSVDKPCAHQPCGTNGICHIVINKKQSYFCSCASGYFGKHCETFDPTCLGHCSTQSICKPKYSGILTGNQKPFCICPAGAFGPTCHLKNDLCETRPCLNNGTCYFTYEMADIQNYACACTSAFYGDHCQYVKASIHIEFNLTNKSIIESNGILASSVQFYDINHKTLHFHIRHQEVYSSLPTDSQYNHDGTISPSISLIKVYDKNYEYAGPWYVILYIKQNQKDINITSDLTTENHCAQVQTLWHLIEGNRSVDAHFESTTAVFQYHRICQAKENSTDTLVCFRDDDYICICDEDYYRVECFGYDQTSDQCHSCLSNGFCLQGDIHDKKDFLCLCSKCHFGQRCQFSNELMSFTLDSLIVSDIQLHKKLSIGVYISIVLSIFSFGFFNNFCSFHTFVRSKPRELGVGNYLLIISVINQCSLLFLQSKMIHIVFGSLGVLVDYDTLNVLSCKIISYLLSVFTRINYWLSSLLTLERLCLVLFPTVATLKKPKVALGLSLLTSLIVSGMHVHEALHYTIIIDPAYAPLNVTLCVTTYVQQSVSVYNRVNVLIHYFIPFLIQIISITILIIQMARIRVKTVGGKRTFRQIFKKQFETKKELYITPAIIIFSAMPQAILSFAYACTPLQEPWQRYTLLTAYFLSYLPQILGFVLHVLPSKTYTNEFLLSKLGQVLWFKELRSSTQ